MKNILKEYINKRIAILGYGLEGKSTYRFLRKLFPEQHMIIADKNDRLDTSLSDSKIEWRLGDKHLDLHDADMIIKSPGVPFPTLLADKKISSQTEIFLSVFRDQIIGITGTKGKSTTSSLIHHCLKEMGIPAVLIGNIGNPPLDVFFNLTKEHVIVYELSAHQLQNISISPHIAILTNLFEEHLDHFHTMQSYCAAKFNIHLHQNSKDIFIYDSGNSILINFLEGNLSPSVKKAVSIKDADIQHFKSHPLKGLHNLKNILLAKEALLSYGFDSKSVEESLHSFTPLEHRLEYAGFYSGIHFYNDSIATVPEACIAAIQALDKVDTILLGGLDRGISYDILLDYLPTTSIRTIICMGDAGQRIFNQLKVNSEQAKFHVRNIEDSFDTMKNRCRKNHICLLSPAAASYDHYKNFEERGKVFKNGIREHFS